MQDEEYIRWKRENGIDSLYALSEWISERVEDGNMCVYLREDKESYERMMRYLEELPANRETAQELMKAIDEYDFLYYEDELEELLRGKYLKYLTETEIEIYLED